RLGRREKDSVRSAGNVFFGAEDADIGFGFVVVGREIFVRDGPIVAEAVACVGLEIDWREAEGYAAPVVGAATDNARAEPFELRTGSGSVRLALDLPGTVGCEKFAEVSTRLPADAGAAMRKLVRPREHLEVFFGID